MKRKFLMGIPVIALIFAMMVAGCGSDPDPDPDPGKGGTGTGGGGLVLFGDVDTTLTFNDDGDWRNHPDWDRWNSEYRGGEFDIADMYENDKVFIFTYSFSSNIDIDQLDAYFANWTSDELGWAMITDWTLIKSNIKKNTKYEGTIALIPNSAAGDHDLEGNGRNDNTWLVFGISNRNVSTAPVLYFYEFDFSKVYKETPGLDKWTVGDIEFKIDSEYSRTWAEELSTFETKNNVLHIRPLYNSSDYGDFVIQYDLNDYAGQTIQITMSMDVYLKKEARIAWQINNNSPTLFYPVVCGVVKHDPAHPSPNDGPAQTADTWHSISGSYTYTVPNTPIDNDNGKQLYLSGQQIEGAEAYFANASITITVQ